MRIPSSLPLISILCLTSLTPWRVLAGLPARDVLARARAIGTDKPQNEPARLIVTNPDEARLRFPAFVLGIEKAERKVIGCAPDRGLDLSRAATDVREQIRRTFHETPLASDCLFVSHIAEFVPTSDPAIFAPVLRYDAYREVNPPAPREVFESGRQATLTLGVRLKEVAEGRGTAGRPVSHLIVFATGWHTPQVRTLANMDELFGSIAAAAAGDATFSPLFLGVSWPSFSDEIGGKIGKGGETVAEWARRQLDGSDEDVRTRRKLELIRKVGKLAPFLNDPEIVDRIGFLGYPAISKDADEIGLVPVSTLVNQVLSPLREGLPRKPRVIVIGHSFGARIASWSAFTGPLLSAPEGAASATGPDLVIGLQGAFPAARFDRTVTHHRPYVEGSPFADHAGLPTTFAYTCANDKALRHGQIFDTMIGDAATFERAREKRIAAFSTCKVIGDEVAALKLDPIPDPAWRKVALIDARTIISGHNDVRNAKVGWLVWTLIKTLPTR